VTLAVGMAKVIEDAGQAAGVTADWLLKYWYHFAIMFEALFILTTIDTGTRIARFLLQEALGKLHPKFEKTDWLPGAALSTLIVTAAWGGLVATGSVATIWPMFGIANQLLASVALAVATTVIINAGRARYAWVTLAPLAFVAVTTLTAGVLSVRDNFYPMTVSPDAALHVQGYVNTISTIVMMLCVVVILASAVMKWSGVLSGRIKVLPSAA
jgi:carbon starvation protein